MFDLTQKTALVTGAGSGIGRAIAQRFARAGAQVCVADLAAEGGRETVALIAAEGGRAEFAALDVTDEAAAAALAARLNARHGALDILVNNAGVGHVGTILQTGGADLDRLYRVNVRGVFNVTKAFLPAMLAQRRGSVINLASIGGVRAVRERFAYVATKFAVVGMTLQLTLDHAAEGVRFNCICPGRVETPFVQARLKEYPDPAQAYREMSATQLIGRMGRPEEVAAAAHYLASDEAALVTGATLLADGGWSVGK